MIIPSVSTLGYVYYRCIYANETRRSTSLPVHTNTLSQTTRLWQWRDDHPGLILYICDLALTANDFETDPWHGFCWEWSTSKWSRMDRGSESWCTSIKPGHVDRHKALADIDNESSFIRTILFPMAEKFSQDGRYKDAVYTYELANVKLYFLLICIPQPCTLGLQRGSRHSMQWAGDALQRLFAQQSVSQSQQQVVSSEAIVQFTLHVLKGYENNQHITKLVEEVKKMTIRVLLQFMKSRELYVKKQYEQALQVSRAKMGSHLLTKCDRSFPKRVWFHYMTAMAKCSGWQTSLNIWMYPLARTFQTWSL